MTDNTATAADAAYEAVRQLPANQHDTVVRYLAERLRADRQIAEAKAFGGAAEPAFWLPAEDDVTDFGYESAGAVVMETDRDWSKVHAVIGWGPVAAKFVVLVPVGDDDNGISYEVEVFDQIEAAQRLCDSINEPQP